MKLKIIITYFTSCIMFFASCSQQSKGGINKAEGNEQLLKLRIDSLREAELSGIKKLNFEEFYKKAMMIDSGEVMLKINHAYSVAHQKSDYKEALNELRVLFDKYPNNPELLFAYGTIIYSFNPDSAFYYCEKSLAIEPKNWMNWYYLSMYYDEQKITQKSLQAINNAIAIRPNNIKLRLVRGAFKMEIEDYKGAYEDMDTIPEGISDPNFYGNRAECLFHLNKFELAILDCDKYLAISKNPISDIYITRAYSKINLKRNYEGYEDLKKAKEMGNNSADDTYKQLDEYFKTHTKSD
jgi:tetratricopeptide (TPR) repeat protein